MTTESTALKTLLTASSSVFLLFFSFENNPFPITVVLEDNELRVHLHRSAYASARTLESRYQWKDGSYRSRDISRWMWPMYVIRSVREKSWLGGRSFLDIPRLFSYADKRRTVGQLSFSLSQTSKSRTESFGDCLQSSAYAKQIHLTRISLVVRAASFFESEQFSSSIRRTIHDTSTSTLQSYWFVLVRSSSSMPFSRSTLTTATVFVCRWSRNAASMWSRAEQTSMQGQAQTSTSIFSWKLRQSSADCELEDVVNLLV